MSTATFTIVHAGPHVSVQDLGRPGLMRYGVPVSGPMDRTAFQIANLALGSPSGGTAIEVSVGGLVLECTQGSVTVAVAGGGFAVRLDGQTCGSWHILTVRQGQRLEIRPGPWGSWTYLAFAGTLRAKEWLSSHATHAASGLGGGKLTTGGTLVIERAQVLIKGNSSIPCPISARPKHLLRVVLGPQDRFFDPEAVADLLTARFRLTDAFDRMGVRLSGPALHPAAKLDMPSEALLRGSIQVAGDGVATVLLSDHQTTGGYPKIATIIADDLDGFAQLRPRDALRFQAIDPAAAIAATRTRRHAQTRYFDAISRAAARV